MSVGGITVHTRAPLLGRFPVSVSRGAVGVGGGNHGRGRFEHGHDRLVRAVAPGQASTEPARGLRRLEVNLSRQWVNAGSD